jgi:hypothetical protein
VSFWTDPDLVAQNAAGWVAAAQHDLYVRGPGRTAMVFRRGSDERAFLADLNGHRVGSGPGEVVPGPAGGYEVRTEHGPVHVPAGVSGLPLPGRYRIYWLVRSRVPAGGPERLLLSIDPDPEDAPGFTVEAADRLRPVLLAAFGGGEDELALNRAGRCSRRQRARQVRSLVFAGVAWLVVTLGLGSCFVGFSLDPEARDPGSWNPPASYLVLIRGGALLSATLLGRWLDRICRTVIRLRSPRPVQRLSGWPVLKPGVEDAAWTVSTGGYPFGIPDGAVQAFQRRGRYVLYHVGERLINAEPVPEAGPGAAGPERGATPDPVPEPFPWFTLTGLLGYAAGSLAAPHPASGTFDTWTRPVSVAAAVVVGLAVVAFWSRRRNRLS